MRCDVCSRVPMVKAFLAIMSSLSKYQDEQIFRSDEATSIPTFTASASSTKRPWAATSPSQATWSGTRPSTPTTGDYDDYIAPFLAKLNESRDFTGPLTLFKTWVSPIDDPDNQLEELTPSGARDATKVGRHLLQRYPDLVPTTKKVYADKKSRTKDTAKAFRAFPQEQDVEVIEISSHGEFHSTIPHKYCDNFSKKAGDKEVAKFIEHYTRQPLARLQPHAPFNLSGNDIVGMQQMCGYESAITGEVSKICDIFTPFEWMAFEYAWDVKYAYMVGFGNKLSPYLGFPWLNVTAALFAKLHERESHPGAAERVPDDDGQRFFLSFTHREVPPFLATALGLFDSSSPIDDSLPLHKINFARAWKMSELIPFLGHVGMEKMTCDATSGGVGTLEKPQEFVRVIANTAPRPIPSCQDGPGASCSLREFQKFVDRGMEKYGDFHGVCGKNKKDKDAERQRIEWR
ncbi:hypothetical protein MRB53_040466 [Persea americana]|nr:hypothetical protein MRB53_040466 [Persea americana]